MTKAGETFVRGWKCANTNPQIGEEVFLIKLGDQPRGIIGHGRVERPSYERDHFDPKQAKEGKREKAIDVRFDCLLDYGKDTILTQRELKEKCAAQNTWSPQGSGIEINQEVLPTLRALWNSVVNVRNVHEDDKRIRT